MKIIVVGAGIAGSSLTRLARAKGHEVTLFSAVPPNSLAGVCILRRAYHSVPAERVWFDRSVELYQNWAIPVKKGGYVTSYSRPGEPQRYDGDWRMVNPAHPLLPEDVQGTAIPIGGNAVVTAGEQRYEADAVVLATAGFGSDAARTFGGTWVNTDPNALRDVIHVHHWAPYKTITAGVVGGQARLGSSSAKTAEQARLRGHDMMFKAVELGWTTWDGWRLMLGTRWKSDRLFGREGKLWRLGGFHRTGYALAPAVAEELLWCLERAESKSKGGQG